MSPEVTGCRPHVRASRRFCRSWRRSASVAEVCIRHKPSLPHGATADYTAPTPPVTFDKSTARQHHHDRPSIRGRPPRRTESPRPTDGNPAILAAQSGPPLEKAAATWKPFPHELSRNARDYQIRLPPAILMTTVDRMVARRPPRQVVLLGEPQPPRHPMIGRPTATVKRPPGTASWRWFDSKHRQGLIAGQINSSFPKAGKGKGGPAATLPPKPQAMVYILAGTLGDPRPTRSWVALLPLKSQRGKTIKFAVRGLPLGTRNERLA